jgi:acetoin:2,6-dichlorophenolindophenol oxidoreductase subunit beta
MADTVRETIKSLTRKHLADGRRCFGQCLTAVGWVGGTLPELYEEDGMVELSMADVAGGAILTGIALAGERPIYVVRYQGFQWYNSVSIVNYAAKSKEIWGRSCPIFVRSIAMEGGIGPVAGSSHHSIYDRMPGMKVVSPMTPNEYTEVYSQFMSDDDPYYVSEHRKSYDNTEEMKDILHADSDFVLFPISITRFSAEEARKDLEALGYKVSIIHQLWIKPFTAKDVWVKTLSNSKYGGMVLDDDYTQGTCSNIAHKLMLESTKPVHVMGLKNKTAGFFPTVDNLPPSKEEIVKKVLSIVRDNEVQ